MPFDLELEPNETLIWECRRSWWFLFKALFALAIIAAIAPVLLLLSAPNFASLPYVQAAIYLLIPIVLLAVGVGAFLVTFQYLNEKLILTNDRLVSVSSAPVIWNHSAELDLCEIRDIRIDQDGLGPLLNFGDLNVKSDPDSDPFTFFYGLPEIYARNKDILEQAAVCEVTHHHLEANA